MLQESCLYWNKLWPLDLIFTILNSCSRLRFAHSYVIVLQFFPIFILQLLLSSVVYVGRNETQEEKSQKRSHVWFSFCIQSTCTYTLYSFYCHQNNVLEEFTLYYIVYV